MFDRKPETGGRAVVKNIDGVARETNDFGEAVDGRRDPIETVAATRQVGVAETGQVRGDEGEAIGQKRDEVAEHMARAGEALQQQQVWRAGRTGLAIEDFATVHVGGSIE